MKIKVGDLTVNRLGFGAMRVCGPQPLMIFDGDCGVCRAAVDRWREATGSQIRYAPYQEVASNFRSYLVKIRRMFQPIDYLLVQIRTNAG
jgi:hypothetical protein